MRFKFIGKNITIWDSIKEKTEAKIGKLEKLLPADTTVNVAVSNTKGVNKIEVTIPLYKRILRAEVSDPDMSAAVDLVVDKLERQLKRYKGRLKDRVKKGGNFAEEFGLVNAEEAVVDETAKISKVKSFTIKPMDPEEAVMEMGLSGHNFYMFINSSTEETCLVYKRDDGTYGLLEPQR
ncbi:MAG: ribosome-associated translation inhibitor RaiA [Clostridiales bacterium]|nr:ribosome-associated translation inhibitor RaiA [Clostridiales bacterium]